MYKDKKQAFLLNPDRPIDHNRLAKMAPDFKPGRIQRSEFYCCRFHSKKRSLWTLA